MDGRLCGGSKGSNIRCHTLVERSVLTATARYMMIYSDWESDRYVPLCELLLWRLQRATGALQRQMKEDVYQCWPTRSSFEAEDY